MIGDAARNRLHYWSHSVRHTTAAERQRIGNQIDTAFVIPGSDFVNVHNVELAQLLRRWLRFLKIRLLLGESSERPSQLWGWDAEAVYRCPVAPNKTILPTMRRVSRVLSRRLAIPLK